MVVIRVNGEPLLDERGVLNRRFRMLPRPQRRKPSYYEAHPERLPEPGGAPVPEGSAWGMRIVEEALASSQPDGGAPPS